MKIENTLFITDLDGTLLRGDKTVSRRNQEAMHRWMAAGGRVTIATGRSIPSTSNHIQDIPMNAPAILFNGGLLYDFEKRRVLYEMKFPDSYREMVEYVYAVYPQVGIELLTREDIWVVRFNEVIRMHLDVEHLTHKNTEMNQRHSGVIKVLFGVPLEMVEAFYEDMLVRIPFDVECLLTGESYCELMPKGIHKGFGVKKLREVLKTDYQTICIGDYSNDLQMLQQADFAAAPSSALAAIQKVAGYIAASNERDAIADTMEYLIAQKIVEF